MAFLVATLVPLSYNSGLVAKTPAPFVLSCSRNAIPFSPLAAIRASHAARSARFVSSAATICEGSSESTWNASLGTPNSALASLITSALNIDPWASRLSIIAGDGYPMCERTTISVGREVSAIAARVAASRASRSLAFSPTLITCHPYEAKRAGASSRIAISVGPSIVMWLSS